MQKISVSQILIGLFLVGLCASLLNGISLIVLLLIFGGVGALIVKGVFGVDSQRAMWVYFLTFLIYLSYAFVVDLIYPDMTHLNFFVYPDQIGFLDRAEKLAPMSIGNMWSEAFTKYEYGDVPLFSFFTGLVHKFGDALGGASMMHQKLHVAWFAALCQVFVYGSFRVFYNEVSSSRYTLYYAFLGHLMLFSALFLRDVHITLFYYAAIFFVLESRKNIRGLYLIPLMAFAVLYLRYESGLFMCALLPIFLFVRFKEKINTVFAIIAMLLLLGAAVNVYDFSSVEETASDTLERYEDYSTDGAKASSFGKKLYSLPWGLKHAAIIGFNQMQPFPMWTKIFPLSLKGNSLLAFPSAIASFFWVACIASILVGGIKGVWKKMPASLFCLIGLAVLLLYLTVSNGDTRRVMCMYLPMYILSVASFRALGNETSKQVVFGSVVGLLLLHAVYWSMTLGR